MTTADLVFTRGPVLTMDAARTRATSLAVVGERIAAVGPHGCGGAARAPPPGGAPTRTPRRPPSP
ncbi:hypothetical protein ACFXPY_21205, partial [Streptomyces sp. NPDC059153]|uniref:hypothetical protein n=1 Tax=Streptomyces sp. NPDC059153 TaxID=3346743 RepID=UPI00367E7AA3